MAPQEILGRFDSRTTLKLQSGVSPALISATFVNVGISMCGTSGAKNTIDLYIYNISADHLWISFAMRRTKV
jgi:hypothetical protein